MQENLPLEVHIKNAASSSQVLPTDAMVSERAKKLAATNTDQDQSYQERARKLATEILDINDEDDSKWPHNLRVSRAKVPHLQKVHSNLRQQLKREPENKMEDLCVNKMIWGTFMLVTQQAAVQLGTKTGQSPLRKPEHAG